jgi:hypothetical protein
MILHARQCIDEAVESEMALVTGGGADRANTARNFFRESVM